MNPYHTFISALTLFMVYGCTPVATINIDNLDVSESAIKTIDKRQESEKTTENFSMLSTSCAFGIKRLGDDTTKPDRVTLLRHRVYEEFVAKQLPGKLEINSFVIYHNIQRLARVMGFKGGAAVFANRSSPITDDFHDFFKSAPDAQIIDWYESFHGSDCTPKEALAAYYDKHENPDDKASFIVYLDASIDGKRNYVRHVEPYSNKFGSYTPYQVEAIENSINKFIDQYR
ncbi:MAG: hypothetical protein KBT53_07860 [Porticoccus sp.]|nr:hypothetical protein [Porticoccus sp.]MBQ0808376.1 hypothetical protein [Porticoccus sp.]